MGSYGVLHHCLCSAAHSLQVARRDSTSTSVFSEDDELLLDQVYTDASAPGARDDGEEVTKNEREKTVKSVGCSLIMLMDKLPGTLEITNKHIYFSCDQQEKKESQSCEYHVISLSYHVIVM